MLIAIIISDSFMPEICCTAPLMPQEELIARSDYEIVNDGVSDMEAQVVHLLNLLNPSDN